jgi:predicted amidohydrolase
VTAKKGKEVVKANVNNGIFEESDGAVIFRGENEGLHTRVFLTAQDYATYEGKDLALAILKNEEDNYDESVILTGSEQLEYFQVMLAALKKIVQNTRNKIAIVGFVERINEEIYNGAAITEGQQIIEIHRKEKLPNYTIFDEKRWFTEGKNTTIFELKGKKIGVNICEDIWFESSAKNLKNKGAELIINISASPYRKGKLEAIENILRQRWNENKIPIIYINQVGGQDGIIFYGHSMYFNNGKVIKKCKDFEEEILIVEVK